MSARQRRVALSRMASKMGCRSLRRARNGAQHFRDGRLLIDEFGHPILRLRSGPFCLDILVHAEQFLGLDGEDNIMAPAAVRDSFSRPSKPKMRPNIHVCCRVKTRKWLGWRGMSVLPRELTSFSVRFVP